jgi:glycine hydroxymethyltransferase
VCSSDLTDNHLMLLKLTKFDTTGKEIEGLLDECRITVNKNTIPDDPQSPFVTSGIRLGTPSVTTRGMKEKQMETIASLISRVIKEKRAALTDVAAQVGILCREFPLYDKLDT